MIKMIKITRSTLLAVGTLLSLSSSAIVNAAPFKSATVPKDAEWYVHADLDKARDLSIAKEMADLLGKLGEHRGGPLGASGIEMMEAIFPKIAGVTLYGGGGANGGQDVVLRIEIKGDLDREKVLEVLSGGKKTDSKIYKGVEIHSSDLGGVGGFLAFPDKASVLWSNERNALVHALDVSAGRAEFAAPFAGFAGKDSLLVAGISPKSLDFDEESIPLGDCDAVHIRAWEVGKTMHLDLFLDGVRPGEISAITGVFKGVPGMIEMLAMDQAMKGRDRAMKLMDADMQDKGEDVRKPGNQDNASPEKVEPAGDENDDVAALVDEIRNPEDPKITIKRIDEKIKSLSSLNIESKIELPEGGRSIHVKYSFKSKSLLWLLEALVGS